MSSPVDQIKERLSVVDVVSSYIKLTKTGKYYKALSPFANEKTPSFFVSPDRDMFYCFSTNQGGDIFTFVEKMEGVDFKGALRILADRAGVALTESGSRESQDERERLYQALELATQFFEKKLAEFDRARAYLSERGLEEATVARFRIGFAPREWQALSDELIRKGFSSTELEQAGLIKAREGKDGYYDRFRGRIMFPIADSAGRVVAFSGRSFEGDAEEAKYLNSPETPLFEKSKVLFGYDKAKQTIRKHDFSILVEGQMDLVMSHQAGFTNTVAASGTALTKEHLTLLKRLSGNIVMAFDADRAGIASAGKSALLALSAGMDVKVAKLPDGKDPADIIKEDKSAWRTLVRSATHIIEYYLAVVEEAEPDMRNRRKKAAELVFPFVAEIGNAIDREHFIDLIARRLAVSSDAVREEVAKAANKAPLHESAERSVKQPAAKRTPNRKDEITRHLFGIILWQESSKSPVITGTDVRAQLAEILGEAAFADALPDERHAHALSFKAEVMYREVADLPGLVQELLHDLKKIALQERLIALSERIRIAESAGNHTELESLLHESRDATRALTALNETTHGN